MKEAGLTPMQILHCTTANAAKTFGGETGRSYRHRSRPAIYADLVILNSNPVDDIANASDIDSVMKGGKLMKADSILSK